MKITEIPKITLINELFIILEAKTGARRGLRKAKHYEKIDFQPYQSEQT